MFGIAVGVFRMADRLVELASYFAETKTPLRDHDAIRAELASRWSDLSAEEIRRGLEIGIELVKARLQEAERLVTQPVAAMPPPSSRGQHKGTSNNCTI